MIFVHEQDVTKRYFFFSYGSNGADKPFTAIYPFIALFE